MKNKPFSESHVLQELKHYLPSQRALKDFVHHNSLHAFQEMAFFEGIFNASRIFGYKVTFNMNEYRQLYRQGRIRPEILDRVVMRWKGQQELDTWREKMLQQKYEVTYAPLVGQLRASWKKAYNINLDNLLQPLLFRMLCSYLDQGIALWQFPFEDQGLLNAVRTIERSSFASFFHSKRARKLLFSDELSMEKLLDIIVGDARYYEQYLYDQQFGHRGWSGIFSAIEDHPETLLYQKKVDLKDLILLELLLEIDVIDQTLGQKWQPLAVKLALPQPLDNYFATQALTEREEVLQLWQEAFEWDYYDEVLSALSYMAKTKRTKPSINKSFQAVFCIDDREGSIRRHLEAADPDCETLGAPGFFGVAFYYQPFGGKFYEKNCPVPVTPQHLIKETNTPVRQHQAILHSKHSHTFFRGFLASLSLGLWASIRLVLDLFRPRMSADIADAFSHMSAESVLTIENKDPEAVENGLQIGFTTLEMADRVERLLRGIGLLEFAPIIYIVAHGSSSANNPFHSAYDCGACSGRPGAVNARVFAAMANHPEVRAILESRGLYIPPSTRFVGGMHDTASDEVAFYDEHLIPGVHQLSHKNNLLVFEKALDLNAKERARRFASIDINRDIRHIRNEIKKRSVSYFEPRPELGHGTNALCYVGSREKMKGLFLDRRAFLNSYDYRTDPDGSLLLNLLEPLLVVCGGINLEYYFSRMDIEKMGAGTKLPHNVMGLIGVANSSDGDLRPGLPLQTVESHDPIRLLMMVEQHPEAVLKVITSSEEMYSWFDKGWIHLVAVSPETGDLSYFWQGEFIPYHPISAVKHADDILQVIEQTEMMRSNHILDATKENIAVHIYS